MTRALYVIGDVHGEREKLRAAFARIDDHGGSEARVILVGDLVDRGPDSAGVIHELQDRRAAGQDIIVLCGNHDQMFLRFLQTGDLASTVTQYSWLSDIIGGAESLISYGIDPEAGDLWQKAKERIPSEDRDFLASLPFYHQENGYLFVHAGLVPKRALAEQDPQDLIWIRKPFLNFTDPHPWMVVHGHTPVKHPTAYGNRINCDGGAVFGRDLTPVYLNSTGADVLLSNGAPQIAHGS